MTDEFKGVTIAPPTLHVDFVSCVKTENITANIVRKLEKGA